MSLQFITGASGAGKSTYIYRQIIARSEKEPEGRFFILVPDQFTMQTQKDLVSLHDRKGIMNIDVLSFGRLTHRIFEEMGANRLPMLDDTGKSLIIRRVAAGQRGELPVLGGRLGQTGYIHEVKSAISEFMQYGIGLQELDQLTEFSKKRGQLYYKLKDLRTIYEGFQQFIRKKYLTTEELLEVLASYVPQSKLLKDSVIVFDGFTGFTPVQNRVIAELMKQAKEVIVTVTLGSGENPWEEIREQELFSMSKKTIQTLAKLARDVEIPIADVVEIAPKCSPRFSEKGMLQHLEKYLFRYPVCVWKPAPAEVSTQSASAGMAAQECAETGGQEHCVRFAVRADPPSGSLHTAGGGAPDLYRNPAARDAAELLLSGYRGDLRGLHLICKLHRAGVCGIRHSGLSGSDAGRHPESVYRVYKKRTAGTSKKL